jgi:hypothetical protein
VAGGVRTADTSSATSSSRTVAVAASKFAGSGSSDWTGHAPSENRQRSWASRRAACSSSADADRQLPVLRPAAAGGVVVRAHQLRRRLGREDAIAQPGGHGDR